MSRYFHQYPTEMYTEILALLNLTNQVTLELWYEFCYWNDNPEALPMISIGEYAETHRRGFDSFYKNYLKENYNDIQTMELSLDILDIHILCFLHEIGHHMTYILDNDIEGMMVKQALAIKYHYKEITYEEYAKLYRKVKIEKLADNYAVYLVNKHFLTLLKIQERYTYGVTFEGMKELLANG